MAVVRNRDNDKGAKKLIKELRKLNEGPGVKVGWPASDSKAVAAHENSAKTVAEIAIVHEFGDPDRNIPERSMLRGAWDANQKAWNTATDKLAKKISSNKTTVDQALELLGLLMVRDVKARMVEGIAPPLKFRKGTPLIDTAQMLNALTFKKTKGTG